MKRALLVGLVALAACKSAVNVEEGRAYTCTFDGECLSGWHCGEDGVCFDPERRAEGTSCRNRTDCPSDKARPIELWLCVKTPGADEVTFDGTCQRLDKDTSHVCYQDSDCAAARGWRCNLSTQRCAKESSAPETRGPASFPVALLSPGFTGEPRAVAINVNDRRRAFAWLGDELLSLTYEERAAFQVPVDGGDVSELAMSAIGAVMLRKDGTLRLETGLPDAGYTFPSPAQGAHLRTLGGSVAVLTPSGIRSLLGQPLWDAGTHSLSADDVVDIAYVHPANMRGARLLIIDRNGGLGLDMNADFAPEATLRYARLPSNVEHHAGCESGPVGDGGTYRLARVLLPTLDTGATSSVVLLGRDGAEPAYAMMVGSLDRGSGGPTNECNSVQVAICALCPDGSPPANVVPLASYDGTTGPGLFAACKGKSGEQRTFQVQFNGGGGSGNASFGQCRSTVVIDSTVSQGVSDPTVASLVNPESTVTASFGGQLYIPEGYVAATGESYATMRPLLLDAAPSLIVRGPAGTPYDGIIASTDSRFFSYYPGAGLLSGSQSQGDEHVVAFAVSDPTLVVTNLHIFDLQKSDYGADSPRPIAGFGGQTSTISPPFSADLIEVADAGLLVVAANDRLFAADVSAQRAAVDPIPGALLTPRLAPAPGLPISSFAVAAPVVSESNGMGQAFKTDLIGFALAGAELVQFSMNVDDLSWFPEPLSVENLVGFPVEVFGDGAGADRRAFLAFDEGQIYTLPNRTEVGAPLPPGELAHDFVRVCGRTLALTDNAAFQLAAVASKPTWVKLPGLPEVKGAYAGAKLYAGNGEVFLVLANGYTFIIGDRKCQP